MGAVKVMLSEKQLKPRERHNSRLFVDLCENIHIHFREYRFVFSLQEYFEFIDILDKSTADVKSYLHQNPDYEEQKYRTTLMVAGGKSRQIKFLENSPQPNASKYFDDSLRIELQEEYVTDEIHIHYRDFRLCLNRENFKDISESFVESLRALEEFESKNEYIRKSHEDREITGWPQPEEIAASDTALMGVVPVDISKVKSKWHSDMSRDWEPDKYSIECLKNIYRTGSKWTPVLLIREDDIYWVVDGHHRVRAALELGLQQLDAVLINGISWDETALIREAELKLKDFDKQTNYKYNLSSFLKNYVSNSLNSYYRDHFHNLIKEPGLGYKLLKKAKALVLTLPLGNGLKNVITNISGSKRYWR